MTNVLHLVDDVAQATALEAAFRESAPHVRVTTCATPLQLRERFSAAHPCHAVVMDDRVAGLALTPLVRHLRAEDPTVPLILVTDLEGDAATARRALAGVDHVVTRDGGVAIVPALASESRAATDPAGARTKVVVAGAGAVLPPVLATCRRADLTSVALDPDAAAEDPAWSSADALVLVSSSTGEQVAAALQRFRRLHPTMPVVVVAEDRLHDGFLRLDAFDCVPPAAGVERFEDAVDRAARVRRLLTENAQLHARETRLRSIVEHLPDGVVLTTTEGVVLAANLAALALLGLRTSSEAVGRPLDTFVAVTDQSGNTGLPALAPGDGARALQMDVRQEGGRRLVAQVAPHQRDENTPVLLMVLREDGVEPATGVAAEETTEPRQLHAATGPDPRIVELEHELETMRALLESERQAHGAANQGGDDAAGGLSAALEDAHARLAEMAAWRSTLEQRNAALDALRAQDQAELAALRQELETARRQAASVPPADQSAEHPAPAEHTARPEPSAATEPDATRWAFEAAGVGVVLTTASGEILTCSDAAARLCGHPDATTLAAGGRLPEPLLASGLPPAGSVVPHRFEVCYQTPDGLLHWVLGSATWHEPSTTMAPVLQWLLVDRSEHHRSLQRTRFLRHMEGITNVISSAAADCTALVRDAAAATGTDAVDDPTTTEVGDRSPEGAAVHRVSAVLRQLARFGQARARRPAVLRLNDVLASRAQMLSWLAGEDTTCDIRTTQEDLRVNADPADLEDLLAKMVMTGRDCLPAGGTLTLTAGLTRTDAADGAVPVHRLEAALTLTAEGYGSEPVTVLSALADTVARLGGRVVTSHEGWQGTRLSVLLEPVLGLSPEGHTAQAPRAAVTTG